MSATAVGEKRRWMIAAGGAAAMLALVLVLFRAPAPPLQLPQTGPSLPPKSAEPLPIQLAQPTRADALLRDVMVLRDLQPLFLPTEHNASLPEPRLEPGRTFLENETPKLSFPETDLPLTGALPLPVTINGVAAEKATILDALEDNPRGPSMQGFGRANEIIHALSPRGGYIEVFSTASGERLWGAPLPPEARPPGDKPWAPCELLAKIDAAGLAAPLIVTEGSRVDEVDAHFKNFLARTYRIGERLSPGFYRIVVAP